MGRKYREKSIIIIIIIWVLRLGNPYKHTSYERQ